MAGLAIIKHMHNLSDEALCERWVENPYYPRGLIATRQSKINNLLAPFREPAPCHLTQFVA
jgi:hypothetical protein